MPTEPSGVNVFSPKIRDSALVRKFISQGGRGYVAISIQKGTDSVDPDTGTLSLTIWSRDVSVAPQPTNPYGTAQITVTEPDIIKAEKGKYHYEIGPGLTAHRGLLTAIWTYRVDGLSFSFTDHLQVLDPMPTYESFTDAEKLTVEQVTWMFGDLYDSTEGGPHLIEEFQTHWGYERIAQMMQIATMKANFIGNFGNPPTNWSVGSGTTSSTVAGSQVTKTQTLPDGSSTTVTYHTGTSTSSTSGVPSNFTGLIVWGTYLECLRHFRDSYTEIPARPGMDATYTDRRDYWQRWAANLKDEQQSYESALKQAKMSLLSMSRGSLLVAGGIYGGSARGVFQYGTYAAQTRAFRFYPAAPAISWGATSH